MVSRRSELHHEAMSKEPEDTENTERSQEVNEGTTGRLDGEPEQTKETNMQGEIPARPTLVRSESDRMIGGVAAGIAHHFGWDVTVVRLVFLIAMVLGGSGFMAYILAWIFIPAADGEPINLRGRFSQLPSWVLPAAGVLLFLAVVSDLDWDHPGPFLAVALFGAGALLLREPSSATPRTPQSQNAAVSAPATTASMGATSQGFSGTATAPIEHEARRKHESSPLGLYTVAAVFLTVAGASLLDRWNAIDMDGGRYLAAALTVVGAGLLVGGFFGRGRALIPLGVVLLPFVIVAGIVEVPLEGYVGERSFAVHGTMADTSYEMLAGSTTLDLTQASAAEDPRLDVNMAFGEFVIEVPADWRIDLTGEMQGGEVNFFGEKFEGVSLDLSGTRGPESATESLTIDVDAGFGEIRIVQEGDTF